MSSKTALLALVPPLLLLFWLGARGLNADAIWGDEYFTIIDSGGAMFERRTPADIWNGVAARNPWHVPGYFMIVSGWGRLVGWEPAALRALSLLLGLLAVAWTYRLGTATHSRTTGVIAAVIAGTSAYMLHFFHEMRMYTLVALLAVFTLWQYTRLLDRSPRPRDWLGLLVGAVGLLYSHYFGALLLPALGLYHLIFVRKDRRWWGVVGVLILAGLSFLPWVSALLAGIARVTADEGVAVRALSLPEVLARLALLFTSGAVPLVLVLLLVPLRHPRVRRLTLIGALLLVLLLLVNDVFDLILAQRSRYLITMWPVLAVLTGAAISRSGMRRITTTMIVIVWGLVGILNPFDVTADLDGAAYTVPMHRARDVLEQYSQPGGAVISVLPDDVPEQLYGGIDTYYYDPLDLESVLVDHEATDAAQAVEIDDALATVRDRLRVWLAYDPGPVPAVLDEIEAGLADSFNTCGVLSEPYPDLALELYVASPACCPPQMTGRPPLATYGDTITLSGLDTVQTGAALTVTLGWAAPALTGDYAVALHLLDEAGDLVAQGDYGLPVRVFSCQQTTLELTALEAGRYTLSIGVYEPSSGARLPAHSATAPPANDLVPLTTIIID